MCGLKNCAHTPNAIFSPESEGGASPCNSQDGPKISLSGQALAPASLSAWPGEAEAPTTNGTSGPSLPNSSAPVSLQSSLANRLQARLAGIGSPEYSLTWKEWLINGQEPICALRASALRISGNDFTGWPTPNTCNVKGAYQSQELIAARKESGRQQNLQDVVKLAGWPTPDTGSAGGRMSKNPGQKTRPSGTKAQLTLNDAVRLTGQTPASSNAETEKPAAFRLNPLFSLWLMGFPPHEWASCAEQAMPSSRKSRRSS